VNGLHIHAFLTGAEGIDHQDFHANEVSSGKPFTTARVEADDSRLVLVLVLPYGARLRIDPPGAKGGEK
jgi:hypothetical protein